MEKEPFLGFLNLNWDRRVERRTALGSVVPTAFGARSFGQSRTSAQFDGETSPRAEEDESVASERNNARKRKATPKAKGKDSTLSVEDDARAKRSKAADAESEPKEANPAEPPKQDYIHVRARRGQATDSHSLAERVRREKISERMKFLQDLVPGCDKVTGKAVMLDEIINYVQSLQRQVEFLSMKLSTVIPRPDFDVDALFDVKEMNHPRGPVLAYSAFPTEAAGVGFPYVGMDAGRSVGVQLPNLDGFTDASVQLGAFWEDDLQSVVQMGFAQSQETVFSSQAFQVRFGAGSLPTRTPTPTPMTHMKIKL